MGDASDSAASSSLFQPIEVGDVTLAHRVVLAPLTRFRANNRGVHTDLAVEYYAQRASVPGSLLIAEATSISRAADSGSLPHAPGVWNDEQVAAWKRVADAVHAKGSYIYMQLWALGRAARISQPDPDFPYVSASGVPLTGREGIPRPLTGTETKEYVAAWAQAARNAVHIAGFDGIEIHAAHGYLIDQFTEDVSNKRTDEYGGKTAIRISPWSTYQDMRMSDPVPTFSYLVSRLAADHPNLSYLHVVEPGLAGNLDIDPQAGESNEFIRKIWSPRPLVSAGGYTREKAIKVAEETGQLIAFGRAYSSNPDLPLRLLKNIPLMEWDVSTLYLFEDPHGYIDFPFADSADS
ncbi:NADH:flavin oxidoreductase/NADH oxidase [Daedaleopsis nitida]|nr:NADH:flavin oxidoreductase/NADH oxidase [Daedaleopsis nitida]